MSTGALILAAGFSRRLGRPKQEVILGGESLLARAVRLAREAALSPVLVVVHDPRWQDRLSPLGATVLVNTQAGEGMATSLTLGILWAQEASLPGLVVMTCDQPALSTTHLQALCREPGHITASRYGGRTGVPAYFPAAAFPDLLALRGDEGARSLLRDAATIADEALLLDIDTEQDLERARQLLLPHTDALDDPRPDSA